MLEPSTINPFDQATEKAPYILLIEDDPITQKVHTSMLQRLGCTIDLAIDGEQALNLCANRYDIILLDCGLPDMDGIELAKQLRMKEQVLGITNRPHILLTAFSSDYFIDDYETTRINDYAIKPVQYDILQGLLQKWLMYAN